jgi:hypothetical protein
MKLPLFTSLLSGWDKGSKYSYQIYRFTFEKTEINDSGNPLRWPRDAPYPQKLALTSPTSGDRSVGRVRSRTKAAEFSF